LQDLKAFEKPILTIFNKMDLYEQHTFDEWLEDDVKTEILRDLKEKWQNITQGNCVFISALERKNIDELRQTILNKVRDMYQVRYPYKSEYFF
jgi:GTP-binding protein HflX